MDKVQLLIERNRKLILLNFENDQMQSSKLTEDPGLGYPLYTSPRKALVEKKREKLGKNREKLAKIGKKCLIIILSCLTEYNVN